MTYMTSFSFVSQITRSDTTPHIKLTVSLVITDDHFNPWDVLSQPRNIKKWTNQHLGLTSSGFCSHSIVTTCFQLFWSPFFAFLSCVFFNIAWRKKIVTNKWKHNKKHITKIILTGLFYHLLSWFLIIPDGWGEKHLTNNLVKGEHW